MALILGKLKCCFCDKKDGILTSVCAYGSYSGISSRTFYHEECLELVEAEPEKFGHGMMDKAIDINDRKRECRKRFNDHVIPKFKEKVETLHAANFERMMPQK